VLLVTIVLGLVPVLGLTPSARAFIPAVAVPVAKAVGATAISALGAKGFEAMMDTPDDWGPDGPDGEQAKKKRGKWGDKLKGAPGLAVGILGGLVTLVDGAQLLQGDGDGVAARDDFAKDATTDVSDGVTPLTGSWAEFTITAVHWDVAWRDSPGVFTARFEADCRRTSDTYYGCVEDGETVTGITVRYSCGDGSEALLSWVLNDPGGRNTTAPCAASGGVKAQEFVRSGVFGATRRGVTNPEKYVNPHWVDGEGMPSTSVTAEVTCVASNGGRQVFSKTVGGGEVMPMVSCPAGWIPESIGWTKSTPGGTEDLGGIKTTTPAEYPDCPPGACTRVITVDGTPCEYGRPECYDWMRTDPPSRVKCEYGPYNMPLAECADLEHVHKSTWGVTPEYGPEGQPQWVPARPDGTPDETKIGTIPRWDDEENPQYRPPRPGPWVGAPPETGPTTQPSSTPAPTPTSVPPGTPGPVPNPPGGPIDPENPTKNCIAGMASWNPVDWVYTPVKCALVWAFVPKNGGGKMKDIRDKFVDGGFGPWLGIPALMLGDLPQGGGCMGPPLNMPAQLGGNTYYPLNACNDPMSKYAEMSRSVITLVVGFYGMFAIINSLSTSLTGYRMFEREYGRIENQAVGK
jgi:hypothetical protein